MIKSQRVKNLFYGRKEVKMRTFSIIFVVLFSSAMLLGEVNHNAVIICGDTPERSKRFAAVGKSDTIINSSIGIWNDGKG